MPYLYSNAFTLKRDRGALWEEKDISQMSIRSLTNQLMDVKVVVTHSVVEGYFHFSIYDIFNLVEQPSQTLEEFLVTNGNRTLPTANGDLVIRKKHWCGADAWSIDFDVVDAKHDSHPETPWPLDDRKDLLLRRSNTDYKDLYDHCLVTVNGYLHRTSYSEHGLYVLDGAYNGRIANDTQVGLISFKDVAPIKIIDINSSMLFHPAPDHKSYEYAYLNLGVPTENKTVLLSIGGYLHALDNSYRVFGDGLVRIDFNNLPILQRFFDSKNIIDLSSIEPEPFREGENHYLSDDLLRSEEFIAGLMDLTQTFAIIIEHSSLRIERKMVESSDLPGVFYYHEFPTLPLRTQRGLLKEYVSRHEDGIWVINCKGTLVPRYQFEKGPYREDHSVVGHRIPSKPYYEDRGFLLDLYVNEIVVK
jgi:hypothetical protein